MPRLRVIALAALVGPLLSGCVLPGSTAGVYPPGQVAPPSFERNDPGLPAGPKATPARKRSGASEGRKLDVPG